MQIFSSFIMGSFIHFKSVMLSTLLDPCPVLILTPFMCGHGFFEKSEVSWLEVPLHAYRLWEYSVLINRRSAIFFISRREWIDSFLFMPSQREHEKKKCEKWFISKNSKKWSMSLFWKSVHQPLITPPPLASFPPIKILVSLKMVKKWDLLEEVEKCLFWIDCPLRYPWRAGAKHARHCLMANLSVLCQKQCYALLDVFISCIVDEWEEKRVPPSPKVH